MNSELCDCGAMFPFLHLNFDESFTFLVRLEAQNYEEKKTQTGNFFLENLGKLCMCVAGGGRRRTRFIA